MMLVRTPQHAVIDVSSRLVCVGEKVGPRGMNTLEIRNMQMTISEPWKVPFILPARRLSPYLAAVEALQLCGQVDSTFAVGLHQSLAEHTLDTYSGLAHGSYGPRARGQLARVVEELVRDPDSRRAVVTIHNSSDLFAGASRFYERDVPCTISIQFFIRSEALHMTVTMRSNDVFLGLPYDLIQFGALQGMIAAALELPMGSYTHQAGSMHVYERDLPTVEKMLETFSLSEPVNITPILWSTGSISDLSARARAILAGHPYSRIFPAGQATRFERFLFDQMQPVRHYINGL